MIPLLEVTNLKKYFPTNKWTNAKQSGMIHAVDGVSFQLNQGETFGLVGESGCGKSTLGRLISGIYPVTEGTIAFKGEDITNYSHQKLIPFRKQIQFIFQDPYGSLNPRQTIGEILAEPIRVHHLIQDKNAISERVFSLLEMVGLAPDHFKRYPHEFSGGQRQRIVIARALTLNPELIICDEPVSALDVSIQAQIINLLTDLQQQLGLTYIFIAHNLSVIKHISDRVTVMYLGKIVESTTKKVLYESPLHPYTQALLSAIPHPNPTIKKDRIILQGEVPSPLNPPSGCRFQTRCPKVFDRCFSEEPILKNPAPDHMVACHLY